MKDDALLEVMKYISLQNTPKHDWTFLARMMDPPRAYKIEEMVPGTKRPSLAETNQFAETAQFVRNAVRLQKSFNNIDSTIELSYSMLNSFKFPIY